MKGNTLGTMSLGVFGSGGKGKHSKQAGLVASSAGAGGERYLQLQLLLCSFSSCRLQTHTHLHL